MEIIRLNNVTLKLKALSLIINELYDMPSGYLYVASPIETINKDSLAMIYSSELFDGEMLEELYPEIIQKYNLNRIISLQRAEDALINAFYQKEQPTLQELIKCLAFHAEKSGYLDLR